MHNASMIEVSWANGEARHTGYGRVSLFRAPWRALLFYLSCKNTYMKGRKQMKKTLKNLTLIILSLILLFSFFACEKKVDAKGLWENATYLSDTTVGKGEKSVTVEIVAADQSITLTVKTDKDDLGAALYEHGIINDPSFFDTCNGILASWEKDQAYWAFKCDGKMMNYGVDDQKIVGGESFTLEYTK